MFLDDYLAPCPGYGWEGGPNFSTSIEVLQNGDENRNAEWAEARHSYSAPFLNISKEAYRSLKTMFFACHGMLYAFRLVDELDHEADNEIFGAGDGVEDTFQLRKISVVDGAEYSRNVYALPAIPTITVNGTPTTAFSINLRTGQVRFDSPPAGAAVLRWSGAFDIWVRFATDSLRFSLDNPNATNGTVELIEVPPPREGFST